MHYFVVVWCCCCLPGLLRALLDSQLYTVYKHIRKLWSWLKMPCSLGESMNGKSQMKQYRQKRHCLTILSNGLHVSNITIAEAFVSITGKKNKMGLAGDRGILILGISKHKGQDWKRSNSACLKSQEWDNGSWNPGANKGRKNPKYKTDKITVKLT